MNENTREGLEDEVREYVQLRMDAFKLKCIDHVSTLIGLFFSYAVVLFFLGLAFLSFLVLILLALAGWMGWLVVLAMAGAGMAVAAFAVYLCRKRLFADAMVGVLCQMFFENKKGDDD